MPEKEQCAQKIQEKYKHLSFFYFKHSKILEEELKHMIISVINKKGGVGKTAFSFSIAKDFGLFLQSNDNSLIEQLYQGKAKISAYPKLIPFKVRSNQREKSPDA
ncbi:hypothetical protein [Helicobacter suis]|uniref:hypothetical protein n=1 Tax=Helicobacter suis TaxID=104628 RepID=UPI00222E8804|nr:hypothetical protein [Helicobacter suis]